MFLSEANLMFNVPQFHPSLSSHMIERSYAGTSIRLPQTLLPLTLTIPHTIFRTMGTEHVVEVAPLTAQSIGQGKSQAHIVTIVFSNISPHTYQLPDDGRGLCQLFLMGKRLADRRL